MANLKYIIKAGQTCTVTTATTPIVVNCAGGSGINSSTFVELSDYLNDGDEIPVACFAAPTQKLADATWYFTGKGVWSKTNSTLTVAATEYVYGTIATGNAYIVCALTAGCIEDYVKLLPITAFFEESISGSTVSANKFNPTGSDLNIYVATDGDDANKGDTASTALKTLGAAVRLINRFTPSIKNDLTLWIAPGTYNESVTFYARNGYIITIKANYAMPGVEFNGTESQINTIIANAPKITGAVVLEDSVAEIQFINFGNKLENLSNDNLNLWRCVFSGNSDDTLVNRFKDVFLHFPIFNGKSTKRLLAAYGTTPVANSGDVSIDNYNYGDWALVGQCYWEEGFAYTTGTGSTIIFHNNSYVTLPCATATGRRYYAADNAVINSSGAVAGYLPGSIDGVVETGGSYG